MAAEQLGRLADYLDQRRAADTQPGGEQKSA
jgi:hypothetical protein